MGATFKENVSDIRNSKVADVIRGMMDQSMEVHITDPHANSDQLQHEYGFGLTSKLDNDYDAVVIAVPHNAYLQMSESDFAEMTTADALIADVKGILRGKN